MRLKSNELFETVGFVQDLVFLEFDIRPLLSNLLVEQQQGRIMG